MKINVGFSRYYAVDPMLLPLRNPIEYHEEFLFTPMLSPKRFDTFSA